MFIALINTKYLFMTKTTQHDIGITRRAAVAASKVEFATQDAIEAEMCNQRHRFAHCDTLAH